jgi:acetyl-CoA carboxylase carboxyl transferase subunit alpha
MKGFGLVDAIIPEPPGGAHWDYAESATILKEHLLNVLEELKSIAPEERISQRIVKFGKMGSWEELPASTQSFPGEEANSNGLGAVPSETTSA